MKKLIFLSSTGGSVIKKLFLHDFVKKITECVVVDRDCGAKVVAENSSIPVIKLESDSGNEFSTKLDSLFSDNEKIFISFYTRVLTPVFLDKRKGHVFNCHPSILPSFKGLNGFDDTFQSNVLFMGSTIHEVTNEIDGGRPVIQASIPIDRKIGIEKCRDKVFLSQYYSTLQFIIWLIEGNIYFEEESWKHEGALYENNIFSPNLDKNFFKKLNIVNEL